MEDVTAATFRSCALQDFAADKGSLERPGVLQTDAHSVKAGMSLTDPLHVRFKPSKFTRKQLQVLAMMLVLVACYRQFGMQAASCAMLLGLVVHNCMLLHLTGCNGLMRVLSCPAL